MKTTMIQRRCRSALPLVGWLRQDAGHGLSFRHTFGHAEGPRECYAGACVVN
jgi:hypothetical protein